jgi:signal transduction histidine kinase
LGNSKDELIVAGILQNHYLSIGNDEQYAAILENLLQRNPYFFNELNETNVHYRSLLSTHKGGAESIEDIRKSISMLRRLNHGTSLVTCMTRLGRLLTMDGRYNEGFDTLRHALQLSPHSLPIRMTLYYIMYENRRAAGDLPSALEYYTNYHSARDSINSEKALANIRELEVKFNTKEKELALLQEQARTRQRTSQRNFVITGAAAVLWFSLFGILFFWNRTRLQKKLAIQAESINHQKIQQLEQENKLLAMSSMIEGQEAERKRIAQDLHDGLGGLLSSVKAQLNLIQHHVAKLESGNLYQKANTLIDNASAELRRISHNMMPSSLSRLGLVAALEDLCASLRADHRLDVDLEIFGLNERLNETTEVMLYRIVQELCNNVVKHAQASSLLVQINKAQDEVFLIVEDNGVGMDPGVPEHANGIGMKSIESRVKFLNGTMDIGGGSSGGTCITVHFPVPDQ